ncbi:MAG: phenylalanine--tRNA ligase subunit beta [bacterium]
MKVSYDWLQQYCRVGVAPAELARMMPGLGLEVEAVTEPGADTVFELEITANRSDLLSMIGVARELAAATGTELDVPEVGLPEPGAESIDDLTSVDLQAPDLCLRYTARLVRGVTIGPSPSWLADRLERLGLRPVNNVVDITNFVLMECGQPLHAFDFGRLAEGRIVVRRADPGETLTVIDGTEHELTDEMLVIADADRPTAVAGVMGGLETEIGDDTTDILLESAWFLPAGIRRTSRALGLASDSSYRFERGIDPAGVDWGSERAAAMIVEIAGGTLADGVIDVGRPPGQPAVVRLRPDRASRVIGVDIPADRQRAMLETLGFESAEDHDDAIAFRVPLCRPDVTREIDLIEEVARLYGYDKVPKETKMRVRAVPEQPVDLLARKVRDLAASMGYNEARTSSFSSTALAGQFRHWSPEPNVLRNPVSQDEPALRTSLLPGLLGAKRTNLHKGTPAVALFELSRIYERRADGPGERTCLAFLDDDGFESLRGALDVLFEHLGLAGRVHYAPYGDANLAAGASAKLTLAGRTLGLAGRITREAAAGLDLKETPVVAELDFDALLEAAELERRYRPVAKFPPVKRDFSLVVGESVTWHQLEECVRGQVGPLVETMEFLSVYRGDQIGGDRKAVAFSLTFRAEDRTLTGDEVDKAASDAIQALADRYGAELRR